MGLIRITGGIYGGRRITAPAGIRPAQDRLRQGVFSSLGSAAVEGARVLDLFAGTGAYGIEALSRGAASVCWVERDPKVARVLEANVRSIAQDAAAAQVPIVRADAMDLVRYSGFGPFTLIFADPPYEPGARESVLPRLLRAFGETDAVPENGILVYEQAASAPAASDPAWTLLRDRAVGGSRWVAYGKLSTGG
jgi:16S rRNA (guanine966-N2)-methyltransferase